MKTAIHPQIPRIQKRVNSVAVLIPADSGVTCQPPADDNHASIPRRSRCLNPYPCCLPVVRDIPPAFPSLIPLSEKWRKLERIPVLFLSLNPLISGIPRNPTTTQPVISV
jgi:hypothetical protein